MELAELMSLRPLPGAGLLLNLTRRCPLHCAHCSSSSTMGSEEPDGARLLRFVGSFRADDRPDVLMMSGGEPLLRPDLVTELAGRAHRAGTRSALLTGAFFAADTGSRDTPIPAKILRAITAVDHFSVSVDAFHEREVPRAAVFRTVRRVLDAGVPASLHLVGSGPDDPYLTGLVAEVRETFADRVPMLVNTVRAVGRAASWATARPAAPDPRRALPCSMAAWPVVAHDGTVLACCNQQTVDTRPPPAHLTLGHIAVDTWGEIRERSSSSPALRMIRTVGPANLLHRSAPGASARGYCAGCRRLGEHPEALATADKVASGVAGALLDRHAARLQAEAGPVALVRRHGSARHAGLVSLRPKPASPAPTTPMAQAPPAPGPLVPGPLVPGTVPDSGARHGTSRHGTSQHGTSQRETP
ncbi:radical SAM protein [Streptomyces sp. NPDC088341]|uniref:radical SAM protein n=1 Tax=Streptomyces sp. NPDC088341 TaxID=3154870 RepID=UPI0034482B6F